MYQDTTLFRNQSTDFAHNLDFTETAIATGRVIVIIPGFFPLSEKMNGSGKRLRKNRATDGRTVEGFQETVQILNESCFEINQKGFLPTPLYQ